MGRHSFSNESSRKEKPDEWNQYLNTLDGLETDETIYQAIIDGLNKSSLFTDSIVVTVTSGVVYLRGIVDRFEDSIKIEEFVGTISDVKDIKNELQVKS